MQPCEPKGATLVCDSRVDVIILLDGSGSIGKKGWSTTVALGQSLVSAFASPLNQAQVAVQLFSGPRSFDLYKLCTGRGPQGKVPDIEDDCGISWVTPLTADSGHFTTNMNKTAKLIKALKW